MGRQARLARWAGNAALAVLGCAGLEGAPAPAGKAPARVVKEIDPAHVTHRSLRFVSRAPLAAHEGDPYQYGFLVDDPGGDEVVFTLVRAPEGAVLDGQLLKWTPSRAQAGHRQRFILRAVDEHGEKREQTWNVLPGPEHAHAVLAGPRRRH